MGSDSDLPCMKGAAKVLEGFGVPYEIKIVSAHRTPKKMFRFAQEADARGIECIIAGAGGAAHLPGMVASLTPLPVIGVPVLSSALNGNDSLLSIVQMPKGIPVATVAIHNASNAGLLAVRILGAQDFDLKWKMKEFLDKQETQVLEKATRLETIGFKKYLDEYMNKDAEVLHIPSSKIEKEKEDSKPFIKEEKIESIRDYNSKLKNLTEVIDLT
jgi:phosphoribosylaminoimidazole carboxylase PurE protein